MGYTLLMPVIQLLPPPLTQTHFNTLFLTCVLINLFCITTQSKIVALNTQTFIFLLFLVGCLGNSCLGWFG